jgi:uncharacterized phage infection (PIP) family protein YhgE
MNIFNKLIRNKLFWGGIVIPVLFQIVYLCIAVPAIKDASERMNGFNIAVVNEDAMLGVEISAQLIQLLPFNTEESSNLNASLDTMNDGDLNMVIHIAPDFTAAVMTGEAYISYYINQAAPSMTKQLMEGVAANIDRILNEQAFENVKDALAANSAAVLSQSGLPENVLQLISAQITQAFESLKYINIEADIHKVNNVEGFAQGVLPFFIFLVYFVGSIIMTILHLLAYKQFSGEFSRWKILFSQFITNIAVSLALPGIVIGIIAAFGIPFSLDLWVIWGLLSIGFFTLLYTIQAFTNWFGYPGLVIIVILFPLQLVSSGLIYAKEILPAFYATAGDYLPATYFGNGILKSLYGGSSVSEEILVLLLITAVMLFLSTLSVFKKNGKSSS